MKSLVLIGLLFIYPSFADEDPYGVKAAGKKAKEGVHHKKGDTEVLRKELLAQEASLTEAIQKAEVSLTAANKAVEEAQKAQEGPSQSITLMEALIKTAETDAEALRGSIDKIKNDSVKKVLNDELAKIDKAIASNKTGLAEARKKYQEAEKQVQKAMADQAKVKTEYNKNEKNLIDFNNTRIANMGKLDQIDKEAEAARIAGEKAQQGEIDALRNQIKKMGVGQELASLESKVKDAEIRKLVLEEVLNKAGTGDFVRMKLEGLLMDPAFCKSVSECPNVKTKPNLERLFSSTERERKKDQNSH